MFVVTDGRFLCRLQNGRTRAQVEALLSAARLDELRARLCSRMSFGTAGLRAPMGAGFSRINDLTIIQSTQVSPAHIPPLPL